MSGGQYVFSLYIFLLTLISEVRRLKKVLFYVQDKFNNKTMLDADCY